MVHLLFNADPQGNTLVPVYHWDFGLDEDIRRQWIISPSILHMVLDSGTITVH
jgi:hypothetical protein